MKITFYGAAQTVTGSKHLLQLKTGEKIMLDFGMFQGMGAEADVLNRRLDFSPSQIQYLILSHAHIDHSGLIPFLVKNGFNGKIFATPATIDLCEIMLMDSAFIQQSDIRFINKRRQRMDKKPLEPLYDEKDVEDALDLFVSVDYHKPYKITENVSFTFTDAGHILGSAVVNLTINEDFYEKKICFTGDIGRPSTPILSPAEPFPQCDILITESTYGNRTHENPELSAEALLKIVVETCVMKKGKLIIPAFSVGRTQEIVHILDRLETAGRLPAIKVFVDSPLSTSATNIVRKYKHLFNDSMQEYMNEEDPHPFSFDKLTYVRSVEESKLLNELKEPCIIISASGMADAGRVKHHIMNNIENPNNTILMVGYCEPHSLGARLSRKEKTVRIFGEEYTVKALVENLHSFSAHADADELIDFLKCQDVSKIKKVFLVHGEPEGQKVFKKKLETVGFRNIEIPEIRDSFEL